MFRKIEEYRLDPDFLPPWYNGEERLLLYSNSHADDDLATDSAYAEVTKIYIQSWNFETKCQSQISVFSNSEV
jgi:hypothetical protein